MQSVGSAAGGLVVVALGAAWGLGFNALTYAVSASFLIRVASDLGRPRPAGDGAPRSFRKDLVEGMQYLLHRRPILEATFVFLPANLLASLVGPFLVVYAATRFSSDPSVFGYLVAVLALGAAAGALSVGRMRARRFAGWLLGLSVLGISGAVAAAAVTHSIGVALAASLAFGVAIGMINTTFYSTLQAIVPGEILARVLSIDSVGSFAAVPAGLLIGGILIAQHGVGFCYLVAAIGLAVNGAVALGLRDFRSLRYGS
jgi:MFS family permease